MPKLSANMESRSIQACLLRSFLVVLCTWLGCLTTPIMAQIDDPVQICQALQPSPTLEQFVDELPTPKEIRIDDGRQWVLGTYKIQQKLHRDLPPTTLYAYGTSAATASLPGPTLVTTAGVQSYVRWENHIQDEHHMLTVDNTVMWAAPKKGGVPIVTHLHGAAADSTSDGHPDAWYTAKGEYGPTYITKNYTYPNIQAPTMLWYHDHTFGITRLNVLSGLAGFYLIQPEGKPPSWLPDRKHELHLMLADKQLFHNGSINFPNVGDSPTYHPNWCPEYFGDTVIVNGKAWPYVEVEPQKYRFRLLNAANARVFVLSLSNPNLSFIQIGTDGGMLYEPQSLKTLTLAPAERIDLIVDFSLAPDSEVILNNTGPAPYPSGDPSFSPPSTLAVMKFIVKKADSLSQADPPVPATLRAPDPAIIDVKNALVRQLFMTEIDDDVGHPLYSLQSNLTWRDPVTEVPVLGSTEIWEFINFTPDAHPMHVHLIQFKALNQQPFDLARWTAGDCQIFNTTFDTPGTCFTGEPVAPSPNQIGWKDTILSLPSYVTRIVVQWTEYDGGPFVFDATAGPGYVWHCHILDHEDNDMMRPIKMIKKHR